MEFSTHKNINDRKIFDKSRKLFYKLMNNGVYGTTRD